MTYAEIINYYINHPEHCAFNYMKCNNVENFAIYYRDPDTGRETLLHRFNAGSAFVTDFPSNLVVACSNEIMIDKLKSLCQNNTL